MVGIIYPIRDRSLLREALIASISYICKCCYKDVSMKSFHKILSSYRDMEDHGYDDVELTVRDVVTTITVTFVICVLATICMFHDTVIW